MKYRVTVDGREREVDVTIAPGPTAAAPSISVSIDGARLDAEIRSIPGGVSVRVGTRVHEVLVAGTSDEVMLASGAARAIGHVLSEKARADRKRAGGGAAAKEMRAPMPGRVVRVLCKIGEAVTQGQPLVVVEAMKMENELRAVADATISEILVVEGASVEGKALLIRFS